MLKTILLVSSFFSESSRDTVEVPRIVCYCLRLSGAEAYIIIALVLPPDELLEDFLVKNIREADLIIADVSSDSVNTTFQLGVAEALGKPIIRIADSEEGIPFMLSGRAPLFYNFKLPLDSFAQALARDINRALDDPATFSAEAKKQSDKKSVFISYSHNDKEYLSRLLVHLRPLEKQGIIDLWVDTKIEVGDRWRTEIERALGRAAIVVLLVSADFLASSFIVDNELLPLLTKAESEGTCIISVILKPCRFSRNEELRAFQAVNGPSNPLINLSEGEKEEIYDKIAEAIERAVGAG